MIKKLYVLLISALISCQSFASFCDRSQLEISSNNYRYVIKLSSGTIGAKNNGLTEFTGQTGAPTYYPLFSGKGTHGHIKGRIIFTNLNNNKSVEIPFYFSPRPLECTVFAPTTKMKDASFELNIEKILRHSLYIHAGH